MNILGSIKNKVLQSYHDVVGQIKAPPKDPQFLQNGMLSPDEFIKSGDKLIFVSPGWQWKKAPDPKLKY